MLQKYCIAMEDIVYWAQCGAPLLCCTERSRAGIRRARPDPPGWSVPCRCPAMPRMSRYVVYKTDKTKQEGNYNGKIRG